MYILKGEKMKDKIIERLDNIDKGKSLIEISDLLNLKTVDEVKELTVAVNELVDEGKLHLTKNNEYLLMKYCSSLITGTIRVNRAGNGFLECDLEDDVYIFRENLNNAIENDFVLVDIVTYRGKKEGKVIKILNRNLNNIVGEITFTDNKIKFVPDNEKLNIIIKLDKEGIDGLVEGHKVLVEIVKEINNKRYLGKVIKVIGHKNDPKVDIMSIAYKHGIEIDFKDEVLKELEDIPAEVQLKDKLKRLDLTKKKIFTIDGADTKDIDDAISLETINGNYLLGVHIADVTNYVKVGTQLYETALNRGTSSYLADTVIPMIPHQLSNGICSLNPEVERLTLSCFMEIDSKGKIVNYDIMESVIKSRKKMTYSAVNKIIMEGITLEGYEEYTESILKMNELAKILRKEKVERGYIEFDLDEAKIIQDADGKAVDIIRRERYDAEKMIEDFMIIANETVASHIYNMDLPFIYRIHDVPNSEKVVDFTNFVKALGYTLNTNTIALTSRSMQEILNELKDKKEYEILSDMLLRCMRKAIYSSGNIGHFGLGSQNYTHFTSPIRRFPDLTVHRLLRTYLFENDLSKETINFNSEYLVQVADQSSERELVAVEAERDVDDMKMAEYMESKVGEEFPGMITSVTNFGMFIKLENLVEGLVHISTLKGFYNYVPEMLSLVSKDKKKNYRLGDSIRIKVVGASKDTGKIDFEIVEVKDENTKQESQI